MEQPPLPQLTIQVTAQGVVLTQLLGNGLSISQVLNPEAMDELVRQWQKQKPVALDIIKAIRSSKL